MKKSKTAKKRVGRPATGTDPLVSARIDARVLDAVDIFAKLKSITRSDALRELIKTGVQLSNFRGTPVMTEVDIYRDEPVVRVYRLDGVDQYVISQRDEAIRAAKDAGDDDLAILLRERFKQAKAQKL